jgi:hypothetical protein
MKTVPASIVVSSRSAGYGRLHWSLPSALIQDAASFRKSSSRWRSAGVEVADLVVHAVQVASERRDGAAHGAFGRVPGAGPEHDRHAGADLQESRFVGRGHPGRDLVGVAHLLDAEAGQVARGSLGDVAGLGKPRGLLEKPIRVVRCLRRPGHVIDEAMAEPQHRPRSGLHLQPLGDLLGRGRQLDAEGLVRSAARVGHVGGVGVAVLRELQVLEAGRVQLEDLVLAHLVAETLAGRDESLADQEVQAGADGVARSLEAGRQLGFRRQPSAWAVGAVVDPAS